MAAVKSGKHIYVQGTGNTLESVATDINDPLFCTWDAPTKTFTFIGTSADVRYFYIRNGGVLDVNDGETFQFSNATADDTRFYIDAGGTFNMSGNSILEGRATGTQRTYYWYWNGAVNIIGNGANQPIIRGFRRIYLRETQNNNTYPNDIWHIENAKIYSNGAGANNYCFYVYINGKVRSHIFRNITMDDSQGLNYDTYMFSFLYGSSMGAENITFENNTYVMGERAIHNTGGWALHCKNNTYDGGSASWSVLHYGHPNERARGTLRNYGVGATRSYGQVFAYHEGDTWTDLGSNLCVNVSYGAEALFKDCTWLETSGDAIECKYQGRAMVWSGNTFTDATWYDVSLGWEISFVYGCGVTVNDENGNPIENAKVYFQQMEEKEELHFTTKDNGRLRAIHQLEVALLTYQSRYGNSSGNIETWSDWTGNKKHKVVVTVEGYEVQSQEVVMDQDRELVFDMVLAGQATVENFSQSDIIKV